MMPVVSSDLFEIKVLSLFRFRLDDPSVLSFQLWSLSSAPSLHQVVYAGLSVSLSAGICLLKFLDG